MLAEEGLLQQAGVQQAVDCLRNEADARHLVMVLHSDQVEERRSEYYTHIMVPIGFPALETGDFLDILSTLQNKWNDREPRPEKLLFLYPAGAPRHAV